MTYYQLSLPIMDDQNYIAWSIVAVLALTILLVFAFTKHHTYLSDQRSYTYGHLRMRIETILRPQNLSLLDLLAERAKSNQRLVRALQLSNTFVSDKPEVHKQFVGQAHGLLNHAQRRGWFMFQSIAMEAMEWYGLSESSGCPFASLVQSITLVVILVGLFQVDTPIDSFCHEDITLVANYITTLWALSKKADPIPSSLLNDLNDRLRLLVPDKDTFPQPLNFIVPAWETLWRVVATTVAYAQKDPQIQKEFAYFHDNPSESRFREGQDGSISVKSVVTEVMRLHPPSKHIARMRRGPWCPSWIGRVIGINGMIGYQKKVADVEAILRCEEIWGMDSQVFKPERHHHPIIREQEEVMGFVFGYGPLRCVAATWAPMAASIISGAIIAHLETENYILEQGQCIGSREGWNGWQVRRNPCIVSDS